MITLSDYTPPPIPRLPQRKLVFFDTETSGFEPATADLLEFASVSDDGLPFETKIAISGYDEERADRAVEARRKYQPDFKSWRDVNGYTTSDWRDAPSLAQAMPAICDQLAGRILVGFNIEFDLRFLRAAMERCGIPPRSVLTESIVDVYPLAKSCLPGLESYKLESICTRLGIEPEGVHRAMGGAVRAKLVYEALTGAASKALDPSMMVMRK